MNVAFIHGAGCTPQAFRAQRAAFCDGIFVALPGRGGSPTAGSIADFADAVAGELQARDFNGVVVGHSMGGAIALDLGLRRFPGLRGIVTICSGARLRVAPAILELLDTDFAAACRSLAQSWFAQPGPEDIELAIDMLREVGVRQIRNDFLACDAFDVRDRLDGFPVPLLAIGAHNDSMMPPKFAAFLADRVPDGCARIVDGAGHFAMLERPSETNALLQAFIVGLDTG